MTDWNNKKKVLEAVSESGWALENASKKLQGDKDVVMAAVKVFGYALSDASKKLQGDKDVVLAAIKEEGGAINYASDELKKELSNNREVVLSAVTSSGEALLDFDDAFRSDKEVVLAAVTNDQSCSGEAFKSIDKELQADREVILAAVENDPGCLEYVSEELEVYPEVVMEAIISENQDSSAAEYIADSLLKDKTFMLKALDTLVDYDLICTRSPHILIANADESLWKEKEFVVRALDIVGEGFSGDYNLRYVLYSFDAITGFDGFLSLIDQSLRGDKEIILKAFEWANEDENCDIDILGYANEELKNDPEFMKEVEQYL